MTKKDYIIAILSSLEKDRSMASDLKKFAMLGKLDDKALDGLIDFFRQAMSSVKSSVMKERLRKSAELLAKIRELEKADLLQSEQECGQLEVMLKHL